MDERTAVELCFLDFHKAFVVGEYWILCANFTNLVVSNHLAIWVRNFLSARNFHVRVGNALSN